MTNSAKKKPLKRSSRILIGLLVLGVCAGVFLFTKVRSRSPEALDSSAIAETVAGLPQKSGNHPTMRLNKGLTPPTNKWFSALVFSKSHQPVYGIPLTYKPADGGFELGAPALTAADESTFQSHVPAITTLFDAESYVVSNYDDLSVEITYFDVKGTVLATARLTHGSPYLFVQAHAELRVQLQSKEQFQVTHKNQRATTNFATTRYGLTTEASFQADGNNATNLALTLTKDQRLTLFSLSDLAHDATLFDLAANPIKSTSVSSTSENDKITSTIKLETSNAQPTVFAALPHHQSPTNDAGTKDSLYGTLSLRTGNDFSYSFSAPQLAGSLDIAKLNETQKNELRQLTTADSKNMSLIKTDTYFSGKELYRAANLLQLTRQLNMTSESKQISDNLNTALSQWLTHNNKQTGSTRYFYYDTTIKGIVGVEPSFGSEQFNDHHFHYGYFIYAAAVLAEQDEQFKTKYGAMVDVLIADIANPASTKLFPKWRVFDPYVGHSWASGYSDFADGNNQESVSEAVTAWYGSYLWSNVTDNAELRNQSLWLYQHEANAANSYWLHTNQALPNGYRPPFVPLRWGGKIDYATFFSPRPQAKLGIVLIPMSPGHSYLQAGRDKIPAILQSVQPGTEDFHGQFGDYMVMYEALHDKQAALQKALKLRDSDIDDANSRAYIHAWIYTQ